MHQKTFSQSALLTSGNTSYWLNLVLPY